MQNIGGKQRTFVFRCTIIRFKKENCVCIHTHTHIYNCVSFHPAAMSSYLFIVKYELPEVIRAFLALEESSG